MQERARGVTAKDVERALSAFARVARARGLYQDNSAALARMRADLFRGFSELLDQLSVLSLRVRASAFIYEDQIVLQDEDPEHSLPMALYRDGVRRLDFSRGLMEAELDLLLAAIARGFSFSGLGDDIVADLWKHDLEHIRYLVVDTAIVDAAQAQAPDPRAAGREILSDLDGQIDGLLRAIYGDSGDDVGPRSIHLDGSDITAKSIAASLDSIDEMAPGFHPPRTFLERPAYAAGFEQEAQAETPNRVSARAANAALKALHGDLTTSDKDALAEALLRMFDDAVVSRDIPLATRIVTGVHALPAHDARAQRWLSEAVSDARLRQVATGFLDQHGDSGGDFSQVYRLLKACGVAAVPTILGTLSSFSDAQTRRTLSDLALELGIRDLGPLVELLNNEQLFVVQEALYLLNRLNTPGAHEIERYAEESPRVEVRIAALLAIAERTPSEAVARAERMLRDPEPRAVVAAASILNRLGGKEAASIIERHVETADLEALSSEVARELFRTYARLCQVRSLHLLARYVKKGEGLLAKKDTEELAVAAMDGVMIVQNQRAVEILKKAAVARSKRVREASRARLNLLKGKR